MTYLAIESSLNRMPETWGRVRFKSVARRSRAVQGKGHLQMLSLLSEGRLVPREGAIDRQKAAEQSLHRYLAVRPNQLVINPMWLVGGSVAVTEREGAVSPDYRVFTLSPRINPRYLHHLLRSQPYLEQYQLLVRANTTFDRRIQQHDIDNLPLPLPPMDTQRRIAQFLDTQLRLIERAISLRKQQISIMEQRFRSLIHEGVSMGFSVSRPVSASGLPWLPYVPVGWRLAPTRMVLHLVRSLVGDRWSEYPLLSLTKRGVIPRDIEGNEGKFPASFETYQAVRPGQLVFCLFDVDETPRTVGLATQVGMVTGAYTCFEPVRALADPEFLMWYFTSIDDRKGYRPLYTGMRKVIQTDRFLSARIPLPPMDEQRRIAAALKAESQLLTKSVASLDSIVRLLVERRTSLIAAAVTGQIGPKEPASQATEDVLAESGGAG